MKLLILKFSSTRIFYTGKILQPTAEIGQLLTGANNALWPINHGRGPMLIFVGYYTLYINTGWSRKTDPLVNFDDNFGKHGPILTVFSLLQQEIYGAQNLSYFSHLTFIMLLHYLAKQTLMLVSMSLLRHYCVCV